MAHQHRSAIAKAVLAVALATGAALPFVSDGASAAPLTPNDYNYAWNQWAPKTIKANEAWAVTTGDQSVVVAIVDTGIDATHPDLDGHLIPGINVVTGTTQTDDDWAWGGNGSFLAGIVGAETNNTIGVSGINWNVSLLPVKICSWQFCDVADAAEGIREAADRGADVINVGIFFSSGTPELAEAVTYAQSQGAIVVAPTGNSAMMMMYPGAYPGVVTVGGTTQTDAVLSYSYRGGTLDLVAPAQGIMTTAANGSYGYFTGTAAAAAHVSGVLALLRSLGTSPDAAVAAVLQGAADLGAPGWDADYGAGRLDACGALAAAGHECPTGAATTTPTPTHTNTPVPATATPTRTPTRTPVPTATTAPSSPTPTHTNTFVAPGMSPTPTGTSVSSGASPTHTSTPRPASATPTRTSTAVPPSATPTRTWTPAPPSPTATPAVNCPPGKKKNRRC